MTLIYIDGSSHKWVWDDKPKKKNTTICRNYFVECKWDGTTIIKDGGRRALPLRRQNGAEIVLWLDHFSGKITSPNGSKFFYEGKAVEEAEYKVRLKAVPHLFVSPF
jgi:hypothetical protein